MGAPEYLSPPSPREGWCAAPGLVLHSRNADVRDNPDGVMAGIAAAVAERRQ